MNDAILLPSCAGFALAQFSSAWDCSEEAVRHGKPVLSACRVTPVDSAAGDGALQQGRGPGGLRSSSLQGV